MADGDGASTAALCECPSDAPSGVRDLAAESMFEYGARVGVWRVLKAFASRGVPATAFACALALERLPALAAAVRRAVEDGALDVCCHGYRWEDHIAMGEEEERSRIAQACASLAHTLGAPPRGWYCRTAPSVNTRRLLADHGGFTYDSDAYNDELPYWAPVTRSDGEVVHHLVLPYTLCTNDSKFAPGRAFSTADDFFEFCKAAIDSLLAETRETGQARMMSIGLHPRLIGHPARIGGLHRLLDYLKSLGPENVWLAKRLEIAHFWRDFQPPPSSSSSSSSLPPATSLAPALAPSPSSLQQGLPRLLLTGGGGFVLSHVAKRWLDCHPHGSCVIFDKLSLQTLNEGGNAEAKRFFAPLLASGRLELFTGDVGDQGSWARLATLHGTRFTHVVSGAAITPTPEEEAACGLNIARVNLMGNLRAFEFARRCVPYGLQRFLLVSSDAVLSTPQMGGASLNRPSTPSMPSYMLSKLASESQIQRFSELYPEVSTVAVRFSDVWGIMDRDTGARNRHNAPYWVVKKALCGETIVVEAGSLKEVGWDYIDAPSVARGVVTLLDSAAPPKRFLYELALGRCVSHAELLAAVAGVPPSSLVDGDATKALSDFATRFAPIELVSPGGGGGDGGGGGGEGGAQTPVSVRTLAPDHWLHTAPMQVEAMAEEFGWQPTPFSQAVREYIAWLSGSESGGEEAAAAAADAAGEEAEAEAGEAEVALSPSSGRKLRRGGSFIGAASKKTQARPTTEGVGAKQQGGGGGTGTGGGNKNLLGGLTMVVTGGASGIGKGIVLKAASEGCNVVSMDTRTTPLEGGATTAEALPAGCLGQVVCVNGDVTKKADVEAAVAMAVERWGRLDCFVNNACLDLSDPPHNLKQRLLTATVDDFERTQKVNTIGYFLGAQAAVAQFVRQDPRLETGLRGKLVNITSQHGMVACPENISYGTSKAAAIYMTKQIAVDYASDLVACNGVAPGKILKDGSTRPVAKYSYERTPCSRLGTPADVAGAVCFLASDEAAAYLTGHNLSVDGGWMAY